MAKKVNKKKAIEFIVTCECLACKKKFKLDMMENFTIQLINGIFEKENTIIAGFNFTHVCDKKRPDVRGLGRIIAFKKRIN